MSAAETYAPGEDAKTIKRIAETHYGGYRGMFDAHGWDVPGQRMMTSAASLIVKEYGNIHAFEAAHEAKAAPSAGDVWDQGYTVHLTSFWGWTPETWGTVSYTNPTRVETVIAQTTDPFIMVVYVTKGAADAGPELRGKIVGFYLASHERGNRNDFTSSEHHDRYPDKWQHALRAVRAFSFLPEYRMDIDDFDPTIIDRAQAVAQHGEEVPPAGIEKLRQIPFVEVPVYGSEGTATFEVYVPRRLRGKVKPGPQNRSGYYVEGEPKETEKELYVLVLDGDTDAYIGEAMGDRRIYKIGLSLSPATRRDFLQKAIPQGAFRWRVLKTTRSDGELPYPSFEAAVSGENAMKDELEKNCRWLGGEFYLADETQIDDAWAKGRSAARLVAGRT